MNFLHLDSLSKSLVLTPLHSNTLINHVWNGMNKSLNVASTFFIFYYPSLFSYPSVAYFNLSICEKEIFSEKNISVCLISYIASVALWQTFLTFRVFQLILLRLNTLLHCEESKFEINSTEKWHPPRSQQHGNFATHRKYYSNPVSMLMLFSALTLNKITVTDTLLSPRIFSHVMFFNLLLYTTDHTQVIRKICWAWCFQALVAILIFRGNL